MGFSAVIDLGTNTFRLLIAEVDENGIKPVHSENKIARLGEGFSQEKRFRPSAMERAMRILGSFKNTLDRHPIQHLSVVGTSAFREAENRASLLLSIKENLGLSVEIIRGEEEAHYTFLGANLILQNQTGPMMLVDIGGGSTEFIMTEGATPRQIISAPLGVVALTERHLQGEITTREACNALQKEIEDIIRAHLTKCPQNARFAGTAGTFTTLAAMDQEMRMYDPDKINRYPLSKMAVEAILTRLLPLSRQERCLIPGLEKGREDLIVSGIIIILTLMGLCHFNTVTVSDYGLREGVLVDRYRKAVIKGMG